MTDTTAIPLSCYIRTLNEERMIGDVIKAAFQIADEVIVIDSGSSDRTREIAIEHGARIIDQPWLGNGFQKRIGEEACKHDWLLDLDADEIITKELADEIRLFFKDGAPPHPVYEIPLVTVPPHGKPWTKSYVRPHTKLYDRRLVRSPAHAAWDHFKIPDGASLGRTRAYILHYSFTDLAHLVQKYNSWTSFKAKNTQPKSTIVLLLRLLFAFPFYFIRQYFLRGLWRVGLYGFLFAVIGAFGSWLGDAKLLEKKMMQQGPASSNKDRK